MAAVPSTFSSYQIREKGSFDGLKLVSGQQTPKPRLGEVLVRVHAVSLNNRDLQVAKGTYPGVPDVIVPASDMAGEVVSVGEGVSKWAAGDKVVANFTQGLIAGNFDDPALFASGLGGGCDGVLTQYRLFSQEGLVAMPSNLSYEEASTLPCAPVTSYNALFGDEQPLKPGQAVVLQGTGGVSVIGAQLAIAAGANAIITSSSDEKLKRVADHINKSRNHGGAGHLYTVNYKTHPDWDKEVHKHTKNGRGAERVLEIGGAGTMEKSLSALRMGGTIANIGFLASGNPPDLGKLILFKNAKYRGILIGSRKHLEELVDFVETADIHPVIERVFEFDEAKAAYEFLASGAHIGKVVIKVQ
ncbi:hypothetical protein JCM5296_002147 [Sporobolomyces johnsonii]